MNNESINVTLSDQDDSCSIKFFFGDVVCLAIGDPHFKGDNINQTSIMMSEIEQILELDKNSDAKSGKIDFIVVLGDVLDRHEKIGMQPQCNLTAFFKMLVKYAPTYCLVGNHDRRNNSVFMTSEHSLTPYGGWSNLYIIETTSKFNIKGKNFLFVPYVPVGRFSEALETLFYEENILKLSSVVEKSKFERKLSVYYNAKGCENTAKLAQSVYIHLHQNIDDCEIKYDESEFLKDISGCFAHQEFNGVMVEERPSNSSDSWKKNYPPIFTGHIHKYCELQQNLFYIGTPIQQKFGDEQYNTISILKFEKNTFSHERIELHGPKKIQLNLTIEDLESFVPDPMNIYKIIVDTIDIPSARLLPIVQRLSVENVKIHFISTVSYVDVSNVQRIDQSKKISLKQTILQDLDNLKDNDYLKKLFVAYF